MRSFYSAKSLEEVLARLWEWRSDAQILAGGTDVMVQLLRGEIAPQILLHIERLLELKYLGESDGRLEVGALVTHRQLATDLQVRRAAPALSEAAATIGSWQTQEVGTVGGNVCNASPAADLVPPLLVANAEVRLQEVQGARRLLLGDFIVGRRQTARRAEELVTGLSVEPLPRRSGECYLKVARRGAMEVAVVGLAARLAFAEDHETVIEARLAVCAVAPRPFRASAAEAVLVGSRLDPEAVAEAGRLLEAQAQPIDDARAGADYRRRVLRPLLRRALDGCTRRARAWGEAWN